MGQYFLIVNLDKEEFLDPQKLGSGLKLWEICANNISRLLPHLLRKSSGFGGGDVSDRYSRKLLKRKSKNPNDTTIETIQKEVNKDFSNNGRWAGDRIVVVGDYDESKLFKKADDSFTDISSEVKEEFNKFIEVDDCKLGKK